MYSARVTHALQSPEDLRFYCIPSLPSSWRAPSRSTMTHLHLRAGQIYLMDPPTCEQLCRFLGLSTKAIQCQGRSRRNPMVLSDQKIEYTPCLLSQCAFAESPIPFLKNLFAYRRKGMGYSMTHMGKILAALPLIEEDFNRGGFQHLSEC
ncbi:hypothetical protein FIBSPDRAFT_381334 [Athelia psychrophila]|uniref:Uncharacterized protein n=1 Tax=Athelia psychrophila TaxID=1759441 RepID=A0A167VC63_9AGAM|nr:hypothetical protein FIBSPDRAFT_381334 [Fibularhizoctonia sp. CBS 109695]